MAEPAARRLPRGRHPLSREEVEADQRLRILVAVADTMSAQGYVNTPVADIISSAGVSRATYYSMFSDKLDAFLAAFDFVGEMLVSSMTEATGGGGTPLERVERAMDTYLGTIAAEPRYGAPIDSRAIAYDRGKHAAASVATASDWLSPAPTVARRDSASIAADFISLTSMTSPSSTVDQPSRQWRPLRTRTGTPCCCAQVRALTTSVVSLANTMAAGRLM